MAKPKAITRAIRVFRDAPVVHLHDDGRYTIAAGSITPEPGGYAVIAVDEAEATVKRLVADDARTRLDPTKRKRKTTARKPKPH